MDLPFENPPQLTPAEIDVLQTYSKSVEFDAGEVMMHEGTQSDHALVITKGLAKVSRIMPSGGTRLVAIRGENDLVGEYGSIDGGLRAATVTAGTGLEAARITAEAFRRALDECPTLNSSLLRIMIARVREADSGFVPRAPAQARVMTVLARFALACARTGADGPVQVPVDHWELAGAAGVERGSVSGALRTLKVRRLVAPGRKRVVVLDLPGLIRLCGERE